MRRLVHNLVVVAALAAPMPAQAVVAQQAAHDPCQGHRGPAVIRCQPGHGRRTRGGGHKVSHAGWPAVTGILWMAWAGTNGKSDSGTSCNDELLGLHGNDIVNGGFGRDILWGDQFPTGNNTWQHDVMFGGPGNDWIYSSHGVNNIDGGARQRSHLGPLRPRHDRLRQRLGRRAHQAPLDVQAAPLRAPPAPLSEIAHAGLDLPRAGREDRPRPPDPRQRGKPCRHR